MMSLFHNQYFAFEENTKELYIPRRAAPDVDLLDEIESRYGVRERRPDCDDIIGVSVTSFL